MPNLLIFGATGTLGGATQKKYQDEGWDVICGVRKVVNDCDVLLPITKDNLDPKLTGMSFDAAVFAQGDNVNDSVINSKPEDLAKLFEANVSFIANTVSALMAHDLISQGARVVIISSLWEQYTRQEKFAYSVTKAAVGVLVRSLAVDLGRAKGILVNSVLPGIVNSPMVARTLKPEQIANVLNQTPSGKLPTPEDVANSIFMLGSPINTAISGQGIFVDRGFTIARTI